jgi:hypothetical protein
MRGAVILHIAGWREGCVMANRNSVALLALGACVLIAASFAYMNAGENDPPDPTGNPHGCREPISATGHPAILGLKAQHNSHKAWKRAVEAAYGHRYTWAGARDHDVKCEIIGVKQICTATARPCDG